MTSDRLKLLASSDIIYDNLDNIIEAFVSFYGEERREEIKNKFKSILILKFSSIYTLKSNLQKIKIGIIKDLYGLKEDDYVNINFDGFIQMLEKGERCSIGDSVKNILFGELIENEEIIKRYKEGLYPKLNELVRQYNRIKDILEPYERQVKEDEKKQKDIEKKYYDILVKEFFYLIPEQDIIYYKKYGYPSGLMSNHFGYSCSINLNGHCFDNDNEKKLSSSDTSSYVIESILSDRISLLQKSGFIAKDGEGNPILNPKYEDYLKDEECRKFIESMRSIGEKISQRKKELYKLQSVERVECLEDYKSCRNQIDSKNYLYKNDPFGPFVYEAPISCCYNNYVQSENGLVMSPLILINSGCGELDCTIIHELNHALEAEQIELTNEKSVILGGWDLEETLFKDSQEFEEYTGISRHYELMSEYINDRIAQEITDIMHNKGHYIFFKERTNNTSGYMSVKILLEKFYQEFKYIIIKSRSHANINYIYEQIGKENFEEMNDLVNEFYNKLGFSFKAISAIIDYNKKENTEGARTVAELVAKRDNILRKMEEYYKEKNTVLLN